MAYSAAALSDAIGGGLLADIYYGAIDHPGSEPGEISQVARYCFYADEERASKLLPDNARAGILAARLDCIGDLRRISLAGDVLVTGATLTGDDTDIPCEVLAAALLGGLLTGTQPAPGAVAAYREVNDS